MNAEVGKFIISLQYIIINTKMIVLCHPEIIMVTPHIQSLQSQRVNAFDIMMNLVNMGMCVLLCSQWQDHGRGGGACRPPLLKISVPQSESTYALGKKWGTYHQLSTIADRICTMSYIYFDLMKI